VGSTPMCLGVVSLLCIVSVLIISLYIYIYIYIYRERERERERYDTFTTVVQLQQFKKKKKSTIGYIELICRKIDPMVSLKKKFEVL
jgi:hypothetical protein